MSPADLAHLRHIVATAAPDAIVPLLPVAVLRSLLGAYDLAAELNAQIATLQAECKALRVADADGAGLMERGA